jgi:hypothetical protein
MEGLGRTPVVSERIVAGLGSNSTPLNVDLSGCGLRDDDVSILAQTLGYRNTMLQKLTLDNSSISFTGVGVLLERWSRTFTTSRIPTSSAALLGTRQQVF